MSLSYDEVPYANLCFKQTDPANLKAQAQLFKHITTPINKAKVLEIGCAVGGNIIPLAAKYPNTKFVGVDLSEKQIAKANKKVELLGLTNIELIAKSIDEVKFGRQKFDYIIVHGVYSWVPKKIKQRILEVCGKHLSKHGIAYISFNTLPGWNGLKTIRDMMLYHTKQFNEPQQKITEARNMLAFVNENILSQTGPYKETLQAEMQMLAQTSDSYLYHEYLEETNEPCYFSDFMDDAEKFNLAYLADSDLATVYLGNQKEKVSKTLSQIQDPVRIEQYLDYINNRRFRRTLLVKNDIEINRSLNIDVLENLELIPLYNLVNKVNFEQVEAIKTLEIANMSNPGQKATINGNIACACYLDMIKAYPNAHDLNEISTSTAKKLNLDASEIKAAFATLSLDLLLKGIISVRFPCNIKAAGLNEKPQASKIARLTALEPNLIPNTYHETVKLTADQRLLLQYCTGNNDLNALVNIIHQHILQSELTLNINGKELNKDVKDLKVHVINYVGRNLVEFSRAGLFIA